MEKIEIDGVIIEYNKIYRKIKNPRFEFRSGDLFIFLPENYKDESKIIKKHRRWIKKHYIFFKKAKELSLSLKLNFSSSDSEFREKVKKIVENYAGIFSVKVKKIKFRKMKNKWGYCTSKREIVINSYLRFLPDKLVEYICLHEVVHLLEKKHTKNFYNTIEKFFPDIEKMDIKLSSYYLLLEKSIF